MWRGQFGKGDSVGYYVNSTHMMLHHCIVHVYILFEHVAESISWPRNSLVRSLPTTSVTMTPTISSRESSCLANHGSPHASVHCRLFLFGLSKKLQFMPIATTMTAVHIDRLVLASSTPYSLFC